MEKSEKLYLYIKECFTMDVMCSIFLENYDYVNQAYFYSDLLNKFDGVSRYLLEDDLSDNITYKKISNLKNRADNAAIELIIYRFMSYYSNVIDKKYLLDKKKKSLDLASLSQNYANEINDRMILTKQFTETLEQDLDDKKASVDFFLCAVKKLREYEETIYKMIMKK
ncbi:MAG TPA: hypothetical protein IAA26_00865 [Candidatus Blautia faecipullorum]|nr:hypothetical protein [Candidatus Blautia faecipullorum]